jgi:hypothetical protein
MRLFVADWLKERKYLKRVWRKASGSEILAFRSAHPWRPRAPRHQPSGEKTCASGPHDMETFVTKTVHAEGCIVNIRVVERVTALAKKVSRDVGKGGLRIAGRHISDMFVAGIQLQRSDRVFGHKHHCAIVGDRCRERLRQERGYRHPIGVIASGRKCERHGISDIAVNCVDREHTLTPRWDIGAGLELVCAIGGIVLAVATELPQRRHPELADVDPIFQRRRVSTVFGIAAAAGYSLKADG